MKSEWESPHELSYLPGEYRPFVSTARDERWDDVYASVAPVDIHTYPDPKPIWLLDVMEFRIVVWYRGEQVYTVIRVHKNALERYRGDLYKLTLDKMVAELDKRLDYFDEMGSLDGYP